MLTDYFSCHNNPPPPFKEEKIGVSGVRGALSGRSSCVVASYGKKVALRTYSNLHPRVIQSNNTLGVKKKQRKKRSIYYTRNTRRNFFSLKSFALKLQDLLQCYP